MGVKRVSCFFMYEVWFGKGGGNWICGKIVRRALKIHSFEFTGSRGKVAVLFWCADEMPSMNWFTIMCSVHWRPTETACCGISSNGPIEVSYCLSTKSASFVAELLVHQWPEHIVQVLLVVAILSKFQISYSSERRK